MSAEPSNDLFREEALKHWRHRLDGDALITRSLPLTIITGLLVAITFSLVTWAIFGTYARIESVTGEVVPSGIAAKITADKPGDIIWMGVRDGDLVRAGQPLLTIRTEQALFDGKSPYEERLASVDAQRNLISTQTSEEDRSYATDRARLLQVLADIDRERGEITRQTEFQKSLVASTRQSFEAMKPLLDRGFISKTDYEQRRQIWLNAAAQYQSAIGQLASLDQRRSELLGELGQLPSTHVSKLADFKRTLADLDQRRIDAQGARGFTITAPIAGRVTSVQTSLGKATDGRLPLLSIVPDGAKMEALLFAPSRAVGMAKAGQIVRLRYDAFPSERFGSFTGTITSISRTVLAPTEVDTPIKLPEPVYEIHVALDQQDVAAFGQRMLLSPGMTLKAGIVLDRRSFIHWLLEPIEAIRARG